MIIAAMIVSALVGFMAGRHFGYRKMPRDGRTRNGIWETLKDDDDE